MVPLTISKNIMHLKVA